MLLRACLQAELEHHGLRITIKPACGHQDPGDLRSYREASNPAQHHGLFGGGENIILHLTMRANPKITSHARVANQALSAERLKHAMISIYDAGTRQSACTASSRIQADGTSSYITDEDLS